MRLSLFLILTCGAPAVLGCDSCTNVAPTDGGQVSDADITDRDGPSEGDTGWRRDAAVLDAGEAADAGGDLTDAGGDLDDAAGDLDDAGGVLTDAGGNPIDASEDAGLEVFVAVTFNTGIHPTVGSDGFTLQQREYLDTYYGHGLAWGPAIDQARTFLERVQPDLVAFQEYFDVEECADIPVEARQGFVCEDWTPESPTVAQRILGPGYQLACNVGMPDKCAAVKTAFGTFPSCAEETCRDGLYGSVISGCGRGARIGRGLIQLVQGGTLTVVNVHGSSGYSDEEIDCRVLQVEQVFVDLGDGAPAASGQRNLILGDFNTDPRSVTAILADASARRWNDFVGSDLPFDFINAHVTTYQDLFCIDNMVSDLLTGSCFFPGYTEGYPAVSPEGYFDHVPTVCSIALR